MAADPSTGGRTAGAAVVRKTQLAGSACVCVSGTQRILPIIKRGRHDAIRLPVEAA